MELSEKDKTILKALKQYRPVKILAITKFSTTVLAELRGTQERHVIKLCDTSSVMEHTKNLLIQEAALLRRLNHPNIIKYVDSFQIQDYVIIVTEYANLGDLQTQIKFAREHKNTPQERQFLNMAIITSILGQVCRGLQYIHSQNIIHRDIKPANIFLIKKHGSNKIEAKIADFGVSRYLNTNEQAKTIIGSISYVAPEVLLEKPYNWTCDLWSLGVLVYEMIELEIPYHEEKISMIKKDQKLPPLSYMTPGIFKDLKLAVDGLLKINPEERIEEAQILSMPQINKILQKIDQLQ